MQYDNDIGRTVAPQTSYQLRAVSGTFRGAVFPLEGETVIGRGNTGCHIHFPAQMPGISRRHCSIRKEGSQVLLKDLGSTSGTFLGNGTRLLQNTEYPLTEGQTFYLADSKEMFQLERSAQQVYPEYTPPQQSYTPQQPAYTPPQDTYRQAQYAPVNNGDTGSFGWALLGFFIPLVGLILYLVWKDTKPRNASSAGKGALVSVIVGVILYIIFAGFVFSFMSSMHTRY